MSGMHAPIPRKGNSAARVLAVLVAAGPGGMTGARLESSASVRAAGTVVSGLRRFGHVIDCEYTRTTANEGKVYTYTYRGFKKPKVRRVRRSSR